MEKNMSVIFGIFMVAVLVLTGGMSYLIGINNAEDTVTIEYEDRIEYVDKLVNVTEIVEVEVSDTGLLLDNAVEEFMNELEDKDRWMKCDGYEYDIDEISISKLYDYYSISIDDEVTQVDFKIKLKYDEDSERSCRRTFNPEVIWEEDEDTVISLV
jgi:hypothetical protein